MIDHDTLLDRALRRLAIKGPCYANQLPTAVGRDLVARGWAKREVPFNRSLDHMKPKTIIAITDKGRTQIKDFLRERPGMVSRRRTPAPCRLTK